mmetsp:Transcript_15857/g.66860  ORF Transcript_15857/g.66860 Transcript_15857/m.66860 type:complete len:303 (+) Transcript_15857:3584-4492(+)
MRPERPHFPRLRRVRLAVQVRARARVRHAVRRGRRPGVARHEDGAPVRQLAEDEDVHPDGHDADDARDLHEPAQLFARKRLAVDLVRVRAAGGVPRVSVRVPQRFDRRQVGHERRHRGPVPRHDLHVPLPGQRGLRGRGRGREAGLPGERDVPGAGRVPGAVSAGGVRVRAGDALPQAVLPEEEARGAPGQGGGVRGAGGERGRERRRRRRRRRRRLRRRSRPRSPPAPRTPPPCPGAPRASSSGSTAWGRASPARTRTPPALTAPGTRPAPGTSRSPGSPASRPRPRPRSPRCPGRGTCRS